MAFPFTLIQSLFLLLAFLAIFKSFFAYQKGSVVLGQVCVWILFWVGVGLVVVFPGVTSALADVVGVGRGSDLVVYSALTLLFFLVAWLVTKHEDQERQLTRLTRELALERRRRGK